MRKCKLWFISDSGLARRYSKLPPERRPEHSDFIWIPTSQIEHTTKFPAAEGSPWPIYVITIPEWLADEKGI